MMPPLIKRELRAALRKNAGRIRLNTAVGGVVITLLHLAFGRSAGNSSAGQNLFQLLLLVGCASAIFETVQLSIDLLSLERRNNTLGLLILTGLSGREIFMSKLTGALVIQLCSGLALLPCFAVSFVLGGVPATAFVATAALIPNLTILSLAVSLAASNISRDEDGELLLAGAIGCLLGLTGPAVYYSLAWASSSLPSHSWLLLSPLLGPKLISDLFRTGSPSEFWLNSAITLGYSLALIASAAWLLERTWSEGFRAGRFLRFGRLRWWNWSRVIPKSPAPERQWLDPNPMIWLALRDKRSIQIGWIVACTLAALWLIAVALWPRAWGNLFSALTAALLINGAVGLSATFSAAKRLAFDRRTGALELLLTTPLSVEMIVQGQRQGLWIGFHPLFLGMVWINGILALTAALLANWDTLAWAVAIESWGAMAGLVIIAIRSQTIAQVMWAALNSARPLLAIRKVVCPPGVLVALGFFIYSFQQTNWARDFPQGSTGEFWMASSILITTVLLGALSGRWDSSAAQLKREFRPIAQQPVPEPSDPRFRRWDATKPFPQRTTPALFSRP